MGPVGVIGGRTSLTPLVLRDSAIMRNRVSPYSLYRDLNLFVGPTFCLPALSLIVSADLFTTVLSDSGDGVSEAPIDITSLKAVGVGKAANSEYVLDMSAYFSISPGTTRSRTCRSGCPESCVVVGADVGLRPKGLDGNVSHITSNVSSASRSKCDS